MTTARLPLDEATDLANEIASWLQPGCHKLTVAGSIRRQAPTVGDIELVAQPRQNTFTTLFGDKVATSVLDQWIDHFIYANRWQRHPERPAWGQRLKRLWLPSHAVTVEIWIAAPTSHNYGNILAIRTGDADFSRGLVTSVKYGGLMPLGMVHQHGKLWQAVDDEPLQLPCPTEEDFFSHLIGPGFVPHPTQRNALLIDLMRTHSPAHLRALGKDAPR